MIKESSTSVVMRTTSKNVKGGKRSREMVRINASYRKESMHFQESSYIERMSPVYHHNYEDVLSSGDEDDAKMPEVSEEKGLKLRNIIQRT